MRYMLTPEECASDKYNYPYHSWMGDQEHNGSPCVWCGARRDPLLEAIKEVLKNDRS